MEEGVEVPPPCGGPWFYQPLLRDSRIKAPGFAGGYLLAADIPDKKC
jgi:hypothetical protein